MREVAFVMLLPPLLQVPILMKLLLSLLVEEPISGKVNHPNSHLPLSRSPLKLYAINAEESDIFAQFAPLRIQMPWLMLPLKMMKKPLSLLLKMKMMEFGKLLSFISCFLFLFYSFSFHHYAP